MMLKEMIETLVGLGRDKASFQTYEDAVHRRTVLRHGGELIFEDWPIKDRRMHFESMKGLEAIMEDVAHVAAEIYVDDECIRIVLDEKRRSLAQMNLETSARFSALNQMLTDTPKGLTKHLRRNLSGEPVIDRFIESIRKVDFTRTSTGKSHVEHGRESLGRSVEAEVVQAQDIPSEITVSVPVFQNSGFPPLTRAGVNMLIDLFPEEGQIAFYPGPDQIESALNAALDSIEEHLAESYPGNLVIRGNIAMEDPLR